MKTILYKILKIFLITLAVILLTLLVLGLVFTMHWPWWVSIFIFIGLFGLVVGVFFLWKLLQRRKEQRFVQQIIEDDEKIIKEAPQDKTDYLKELQDKWKEGVKVFDSHLKSPYQLPWYLVIGESGSGKTTAIKSAHLSSPFKDIKEVAGIGGTRNCDWWFFEQAVILDTAGRYTIQIDKERDKEEWQKFLHLLSKYRKKEPINGLIITIAADDLLKGDLDALERHGLTIRKRIDELMRLLGARFPVYVLVTKCDLIEGMADFSDNLSEENLKQAMGAINHSLTSDIESFLTSAIDKIWERLKDLRLLLTHKKKYANQGPGLTIFPEEIEKLKSLLHPLLMAAFGKSQYYKDTPLLRGLFFSSGMQQGSPFSQFLESMKLIDEDKVLPETHKGIFLHDFFSRIIPADRGLFAPIDMYTRWQHLTRNLGILAGMALGIALCGLLSFSYVKNAKFLKDTAIDLKPSLELTHAPPDDLKPMLHLSEVILALEAENYQWFPRIGLYESKSVEKRLKYKEEAVYCTHFRAGPLKVFDQKMKDRIASFSADSNNEIIIGQHVEYLVRRIAFLRNLQKFNENPPLQEDGTPVPPPLFQAQTSLFDTGMMDESDKTFDQLYGHYLHWCSDDTEQESSILQAWLKQIIELNGLNWLIVWFDKRMEPVTLDDYWLGSLPVPEGSKTVSGVFTVKGKKEIDSFYEEIKDALAGFYEVHDKKDDFNRHYGSLAVKSWHVFADHFSMGMQKLNKRKDWLEQGNEMSTDGGPYFVLLAQMNKELLTVVLPKGEQKPPWLKLVYQLGTLRTVYDRQMGGAIEAAGDKLNTQLSEAILREFSRPLDYYKHYRKAHTELDQVLHSRSTAHQVVAQVFNKDISPLTDIDKAISQFQTSLGNKDAAEDTFWLLMEGRRNFLWEFAKNDTSCYLQKTWQENIYDTFQSITFKDAKLEFLTNRNSALWKFILNDGKAEPFINSSSGMYELETAFDNSTIPLNKSFTNYLNAVAQSTDRQKRNQRGYEEAKEKFKRKQQEFEKKQQKFDKDMEKYEKKLEAYNKAKAEREDEQQEYEEKVEQKRTKTIKRPLKTKDYSVSMVAMPTGANDNAIKRPTKAILQLNCRWGQQKFVNLNQRPRKTFKWTNQDCDKVTLRVYVDSDTICSKTYQTFPDFIKAFKGARRFSAGECSSYKNNLDKYIIEFIRVEYKLSGYAPLLNLNLVETVQIPVDVPESELPRKPKPKKGKLPPKPKKPQEPKEPQQPVKPGIRLPQIPQTITTCWD